MKLDKITLSFLLMLGIASAWAIDNFEPLYVDSNGIEWGKKLSEKYTNVASDNQKSEAELACENIGARLPTFDEYVTLIGDFDHRTTKDWPYVNLVCFSGWEGIRNELTDLPRNTVEYYWILTNSTGKFAYVFSPACGYSNFKGYERSHRLSVRCVR